MNSISGNGLTAFDFHGAAVRVIMRDGEPWFVLADVCKVLEIVDVGTASRRLDDDEKGVHTMQTLGGPQETTVINESGLYSLIMTSRKPEAKAFKKWVTGTVLPEIRRTGGFGAPAPMTAIDFNDPVILHQMLLAHTQGHAEQRARAEYAERRIAILKPQAEAWRVSVDHEGAVSLRAAAKNCAVAPMVFIEILRKFKWIYRSGSDWLPYQDKMDAGYLVVKKDDKELPNGKKHYFTQTMVTLKGVAKIKVLIEGTTLL